MTPDSKNRLLTAALSALSITSAIGLALAWNLDKPFWAAFAAMVVSMGTLGQSAQKGLLRMGGTVLGVVAGFAGLAFFAQERMLCLSVLFLYCIVIVHLMFKFKEYSYFFYTSVIVAIVIIIGNSSDVSASFSMGVARMEETVLGIAVYTCFALVLWPRSSEQLLHKSLQELVQLQQKVFTAQCASLQGSPFSLTMYEQLRQALTRCTNVLSAAQLESARVRAKSMEWVSILQYCRELMGQQQRFLLLARRMNPAFTQGPEWKNQEQALLSAFAGMVEPFTPQAATGPAPGQAEAPSESSVQPTVPFAVPPAPDSTLAQAWQATSARMLTLCASIARHRAFLEAGSQNVEGVGNMEDVGQGSPAQKQADRPEHLEVVPEWPTSWVTFAEWWQLLLATLIYWLILGLWIHLDPPGTLSAGFVEMGLMIAFVVFHTGYVNPVEMLVSFIGGCALAFVLSFVVMVHMTTFSEFALLLLMVTFTSAYIFHKPAMGMMRTGFLLPWLSLGQFSEMRAFTTDMFLPSTVGLLSCVGVNALVFYCMERGHPALRFLRGQGRFTKAVDFFMASPEQAAQQSPGLWHSVKRAYYAKIIRDEPSQLLALAFNFNEEDQGLERESVKLAALNMHYLGQQVRATLLEPHLNAVRLTLMRERGEDTRQSLQDTWKSYLESVQNVDWTKLAVHRF